MIAIPSIIKIAGVAIVAALVVGGAWMLRNELIEKGRNLVYAEDNAALVKAQAAQAVKDAQLVKNQADYIRLLEGSGTQVKEKIRAVQGPCAKDGVEDTRLGDTIDFVRGRLSPDPLRPGDRSPAQGTVSPTSLTAPARTGNVR